jgi:hypothetical protein
MTAYAEKLTKRCVRQGDAMGRADTLRVSVLVSGLAIENGASLMNSAGTETYYDKLEVIGALHLGDP